MVAISKIPAILTKQNFFGDIERALKSNLFTQADQPGAEKWFVQSDASTSSDEIDLIHESVSSSSRELNSIKAAGLGKFKELLTRCLKKVTGDKKQPVDLLTVMQPFIITGTSSAKPTDSLLDFLRFILKLTSDNPSAKNLALYLGLIGDKQRKNNFLGKEIHDEYCGLMSEPTESMDGLSPMTVDDIDKAFNELTIDKEAPTNKQALETIVSYLALVIAGKEKIDNVNLNDKFSNSALKKFSKAISGVVDKEVLQKEYKATIDLMKRFVHQGKLAILRNGHFGVVRETRHGDAGEHVPGNIADFWAKALTTIRTL